MARTESTKSLLWKVARKLGMSPSDDPTVNNLTDDQARPILSYLHEAAKMTWDSWDWQDVCVIEQRYYSDPYVSGTTYQLGAYVYDPANGIYYQNNFGVGDPGQPTLFPGVWSQVTLVGQVNLFANPYLLDAPLLSPAPPPPPSTTPNSNLITIPAVVPFVQTGKTDIDTVFGVYATDPRNQTYPIEVSYRITVRGIELMETQLTNVWVFFRPPFPGIGSETWLSTTSYNQYDQVYYNGDSYVALVSNTNVIPGTDGGVTWKLFRVPNYFSAGVVTYSYALALEEDGQTDKAQQQYQKAEGLLIREYDKQQTQQGLGGRYSVLVV